MELPTWYAGWVDAHRSAFMLSADWVVAAEVWWELFQLRGVTGSELAAATRDLMTLGKDAPKFPGDHLPAVERSIGRARNAAAVERRKAYGETDGITCDVCCSSGWVIVPHPNWIRQGRWEPSHYRENGSPAYVTAGVACRCPVGIATADSCLQQKQPTQTLAHYEAICPNWRIEVQEKDHAEHRGRVVSEEAAAVADPRAFEAMKQRLFSGPRG